ncbi:hypothetical protein [Microcoleus sp. BROC3]
MNINSENGHGNAVSLPIYFQAVPGNEYIEGEPQVRFLGISDNY